MKTKLTLAIFALTLGCNAFAWQKDATGTINASDFSVKLPHKIRLSVSFWGNANGAALIATKSTFFGYKEADQQMAACTSKITTERNGDVKEFALAGKLSPDLANDLGVEPKYLSNARFELGLFADKKPGYFRAMTIVYDSRNAPIAIYYDQVGQTPHLLSLAKSISAGTCR